jgi:ubiquitin-conjugating enzyme E2 variant
VLAAGLLLPTHAEWTPPALAFIVSLCMGIFATNQFHKWAHFEQHELSPAIRLLQRMHLILPADHHDVHHTAPYERHYCITSGWLNVPLNTLGFFRGVERAITAVTGVQPRKDDLKDKKL